MQAWTYNSLTPAVPGSGMSMTYNYSPNQNNGQITSSVDAGVTPNETITYTYDALKRLGEADGLNWKENYVYDGFGNLTYMNPTGSAPSLSVSVLTDINGVPNNRITASGVTYDNNGNLTQGFGNLEPVYDAANRMTQVHVNTQPNTYYGYDPDNRRVYSGGTTAGTDTIYLYGVDGKKLATYTASFSGSSPNYTMQLTYQSNNVYFAGRLLSAEGNAVRTDRLGSVRAGGPGNLGSQAQFPYGSEYGTGTANDREKYATYTRDSLTGLDYAMNRYYSSQWGRFLSVDRSRLSARLGDPASWNRYVYSGNDPINRRDPTGNNAEPVFDDEGTLVGYCEDDGNCTYYSGISDITVVADPEPVDPPDPQDPPIPPPQQPPPPTPPVAPSFFELEEVSACAYPQGVGRTKLTSTFTLDVTYQLLLNYQPIFGNSTLNNVGASVFESVTVTSGKSIDANGQWCPAGSLLCATAGSMNSKGQFSDLLAANPFGPSTANQIFSLYEPGGEYTLPVTNFPGAPTLLNNTYANTSVSVSNGAIVGNSHMPICPAIAVPKRPIYRRF